MKPLPAPPDGVTAAPDVAPSPKLDTRAASDRLPTPSDALFVAPDELSVPPDGFLAAPDGVWRPTARGIVRLLEKLCGKWKVGGRVEPRSWRHSAVGATSL